ncbi:MAG: copper resistance protein B [Gammaproteobacteria bacterium]
MTPSARIALLIATMPCVDAVRAMGDADPLLFKAVGKKIEIRKTSGHDHLAWDADLWVGYDINKLWFKFEGENSEDRVEEAEFQALYSRAVTTNWDIQMGWRHDLRPKPERDWAAIGVRGIAPYHFDVDLTAFIGSSGRTAARIDLDYEIIFTQRLVLTPEFEAEFYGKDDPALNIGSGLSQMEAGARLRYEIRREFAPYIGINWWSKFGDTKRFARATGDETSDVELVLGLRIWF